MDEGLCERIGSILASGKVPDADLIRYKLNTIRGYSTCTRTYAFVPDETLRGEEREELLEEKLGVQLVQQQHEKDKIGKVYTMETTYKDLITVLEREDILACKTDPQYQNQLDLESEKEMDAIDMELYPLPPKGTDHVREKGRVLKEKGKSTAGAAWDATKETAVEMKDGLKEAGQYIGSTVKGAYDSEGSKKVRKKVGDAASATKDRIGSAANKTKNFVGGKLRSFGRRFRRKKKEEPPTEASGEIDTEKENP